MVGGGAWKVGMAISNRRECLTQGKKGEEECGKKGREERHGGDSKDDGVRGG